jgi:hypothetical protein
MHHLNARGWLRRPMMNKEAPIKYKGPVKKTSHEKRGG